MKYLLLTLVAATLSLSPALAGSGKACKDCCKDKCTECCKGKCSGCCK